MPLIFKLVGFVINNKYYKIRDSYEGNINLIAIHNLFISWGLTSEEVKQIKFIIDSEQIVNPNKLYLITPNEEHTIFIFVFNQEIRQKLQLIFTKHGTQSVEDTIIDSEISQPITQSDSDTIPMLTPEIINKTNEQTLLLFSDPDFINLISIYKRKPELFNILSSYIQNNDMNNESLIITKDLNELSVEEQTYYTSLCSNIMNLNFGVSQNIIMNKLLKYSGHLNLTIRSIMNDLS